MFSIATVSLLLIAIVSALFAYIQWNKSNELQKVLVESMHQHEKLRSKLHAQQSLSHELQVETAEKKKSQKTKAEKTQENLLKKLAQAKQELHDKELHLESIMETERAKSEHLRAEVRALTSQIVEIDEQKRVLKKELDSLHEQESLIKNAELNASELKESKEKLTHLTTQNKKLSNSVQRLESILKKVDPKETQKVKRKLRQYNMLFATMRGQKEMAEERTKNWERALVKTVDWIIKEKATDIEAPKNIGPKVGLALELIGEHLIEDGENTFDQPVISTSTVTPSTTPEHTI